MDTCRSLLVAFLVGGCAPRIPPEPPVAPDLALGQRVYRASCAPCHGARGQGDGPAAPFLDPQPRALVDAQYKLRTTATGALPTDRDLLRTVTDGVFGTPMRGFRETLSAHQRRSVVAYVQSFSRRFAEETRGPAVEMPAAPAPNVARGRWVWRTMKCAECHGPRGRGDGPSNPTLVNYRNEANPSHDFGLGYLKRGLSRESVYLTLRTGLDGTPMPSYEAAATDADLWALSDYILTLIPRRGAWRWLSDPVDRDYP
ncbi:MAG: cytochrome c [Deltaproteobacteria bacterium]|nr:cytochrome c [Deltaproteobacteria bacterium]